MKKISITIVSMFLSLNAFASTYSCKDNGGKVAELKVLNSTNVFWSEPWHSAESNGVFKDYEQAPYSDYKGYRLYQLVNFAHSPDSSYILAVSALNGDKVKAAVYWDNDDHPEEITEYICVKK
ncbi:MAG TPA: hypothetical protein VN132_12525 [Bdellovibrio sp.]|nr:hypothetical protein [Bdellovibrio sp.]